MAYQTNSSEFFDILIQLLTQNKVTETVQLLSDASSADATLNGDLKFLKLRANKKLMVPAGGMAMGTPQQQIQDVIKLLGEMKKAHIRRKVNVSSLADPKNIGVGIVQAKKKRSGKKRSAMPWVLLTLLVLGGAGGYFFKDKIMNTEVMQTLFSDDVLPEVEPPKKEKNVTKRERPKASKSKIKPSATSIGSWYIQVASYATLDQAKKRRRRVEMSYDRSIILVKTSNGRSTYKILVPGFEGEKDAETFRDDNRVTNLYKGAFVESFSKQCGSLLEKEEFVYECR